MHHNPILCCVYSICREQITRYYNVYLGGGEQNFSYSAEAFWIRRFHIHISIEFKSLFAFLLLLRVEKKITIFSFCPTRTYPKIRMLKENKCFICFYFFSCKNVTKILKIVFLREKQNRRPVSLPYVLYIVQMHNYRRWARAFVKFTHYRCKAVDKKGPPHLPQQRKFR